MKQIILLSLLAAAVSAASFSNIPRPIRPMNDLTRVGRVVGGQESKEGQHPYQVMLRFLGGFTCGGSIFSDQWIITAAHCVYGRPASTLTIVVGSIYQSGQGGDAYGLVRTVMHELYDDDKFEYDIAVAQTAGPISFGINVKPIKLARTLTTGGEHTLSGFGRTGNGEPTSTVLKFVESILQSRTLCTSRTGFSHEGIICFYKGVGEGICSGDSGGPAVIYEEGEPLLVGVTDFVVGGCGGGYPDGYASVPYFNDWITNNTKN